MKAPNYRKNETTLGPAAKNPGIELRKQLGVRLFQVALKWSRPGGRPATKKAQRQVVRSLKGRRHTGPVSSIEKALREVQVAASVIAELRRLRDQYKGRSTPSRSKRPIVRISGVPAAERVRSWSKRRIIEALEDADPIRGEEAPAGCHRSVLLTEDPEQVGYECETWGDWNVYRGAFKGWRATGVTKRITVPADWYRAVCRSGLSVVDGRLTLDAREVSSPIDGVRAYRAVWVEQARGYSVRTVRGYICVKGDTAYHADSLPKAAKGVARKERALHRNAEAAHG